MRLGHPALTILTLILALSIPSSEAAFPCTTVVPTGSVFLETWTQAGSPYCVEGNIQVSLLTIEPGTIIAVDGPFEIQVLSTVSAVGTQSAPVLFTARNDGIPWKGLRFENSQPGSDLIHVIIENSDDSGLEIVDGPSPMLEHCVIRNNSNAVNAGGAIRASGVTSDMNITDCSLSGNVASQHGGALSASMAEVPGDPPGDYYTLTITDSLFQGNVSNPQLSVGGFVGGAIHFVQGNMFVSRSRFINNRANSCCTGTFGCNVLGRGGAIYQASGNVTVTTSEFIENTTYAQNNGDCFFGGSSRSFGAGVYVNGGVVSLDNGLFACNETIHSSCGASDGGGGIYVNGGAATVSNSTFSRNPATTGAHRAGGTLTITNSIVYHNGDGEIGGDVSVTYSDVEQPSGVFPGTGNINTDPVFFGSGCAPRDFILVPGSLCIDGGNPDVTFNDACFPPSSTYGTEINDMGAYGGPVACQWQPHERMDLRFTSKDTLEWLADNVLVESATTYSVYRGNMAPGPWRYDHACLDSGLVSGLAVDTDLPTANEGFYYLVAGSTTSGGEGRLGFSSVLATSSAAASERLLVKRPNTSACVP